MSTRATPEEHEERLLMLLACVKLAGLRLRAKGKPGADVFAIINTFGKVHPSLLGSARERLMSELHRRGLTRLEHRGNQVYWSLTPAGQARLGQARPSFEAELADWIGPGTSGSFLPPRP